MDAQHSGEITIPPSTSVTLTSIMANPVVKLLAGLLLGVLLAYNSVIVTRTDARLEALETGYAGVIERIHSLETKRQVHEAEHKALTKREEERYQKHLREQAARDKQYQENQQVWLESLNGHASRRKG